MDKPIGKYLGNGKIELNDYGLELFINQNIEDRESISHEELIKRVNKKLKGGKKDDNN